MFSSQEWNNGKSLDLVRVASGLPKRPFLVFVVPRSNLASPLLEVLGRERNFDIAARFYDVPAANELLAEQAEYVLTGGLSKFHAAALFLETCKLHEAYEGYLFLDGDLEFDAAGLGRFLSLVYAGRLDLAQPAVTRDSFCYWKMAYHQPSFVFRQTSFVEVMAPYLSRYALSRTCLTFSRSISTYGLDLVWPTLIGSDRIGVVDAFQVRHRETVDHVSGGFYKYLRSIGVDLAEEERRVMREFGVAPHHAHSLRGYFLKGDPSMPREPGILRSIPLPAIERLTNNQALIDAAMRLARLFPSRAEDALGEVLKPHLSAVGDQAAIRGR